MDAEDRPAASGLTERLLKEGRRYSFFQLVQLLQRDAPGAPRVGEQGPASEERLRFRPALDLAFPDADIAGLEVVADPWSGRERLVIETTFLGLYGTVSPLPNYYTEEMIHEVSEESLERPFIDLFHHRIISLFYRCWEKYRYYIQFRTRGADPFSRRFLCLLGLGVAAPSEESAVPAVRLLRYAGLISKKPVSAAAIRGALSDYFEGIPVEVTCCVTRWVTIPHDLRNSLGVAHCSLATDLHAGEQVEDRSGRFRITLGPMGLTAFVRLLPGGDDFSAVDEVSRLFTIDHLQYELELILRRAEIPEIRLAQDSLGTRLGQTTWLGRPPCDARVLLQEPLHGGAAPRLIRGPALAA